MAWFRVASPMWFCRLATRFPAYEDCIDALKTHRRPVLDTGLGFFTGHGHTADGLGSWLTRYYGRSPAVMTDAQS